MATQVEQPEEDTVSHETSGGLVSTNSAPPSSDRNVDGATHSSDGRPEKTPLSASCRFYDDLDSDSSGDDVLVAKGKEDARRAGVPLQNHGTAPLRHPTYAPPAPTAYSSTPPPARPAAPRPGQAPPVRPAPVSQPRQLNNSQTHQQQPAGHPQHPGHGGPGPAAPWQHGVAHGADFAPSPRRAQTPAPPRPQRQAAPARAMTPGTAYGYHAGPNPYGAQAHGQAPTPGAGGQGAPARGQTPAPPPNQPKRGFFSRRF